jgi:hypothetical protein
MDGSNWSYRRSRAVVNPLLNIIPRLTFRFLASKNLGIDQGCPNQVKARGPRRHEMWNVEREVDGVRSAGVRGILEGVRMLGLMSGPGVIWVHMYIAKVRVATS